MTESIKEEQIDAAVYIQSSVEKSSTALKELAGGNRETRTYQRRQALHEVEDAIAALERAKDVLEVDE